MAEVTKSLWTRLMEGGGGGGAGGGNISNNETGKPTCPYDRNSCETRNGRLAKSPEKSLGGKCHPECPEPKRPLQPEEFCPDLGKPKLQPPPKCCFIRMQDPCAPCCCPPPDKCEDECHPGPKRDPICGCDLCKKKQCPDGKCCSSREPSCQKAGVPRCNSETQTSSEYLGTLDRKFSDIYRNPECKCKPSNCRFKINYVEIFKSIKQPLDWLLCTPLKIPIPRIEWHSINCEKPKEDQCDFTLSRPLPTAEKHCLPDIHANGHHLHCCDPNYSTKSKNEIKKFHEKTFCSQDTHDGSRYFQENPRKCKCRPCEVRHIFEGPFSKNEYRQENLHSETCGCRLCRIRRVLQEPIF